ncbi:phosphate ABC transporter substrate-binding protein, partial [Clostridioides difficile]|nr:phosphate ABC transporter substrate-binding protein [Clostridioides difficile]
MFKKKIGVLLASTILVGALAVGCGSNSGGSGNSGNSGDSSKVSVSGSTSIGPLMETIGEKFQEK